jgi:hypothetical protein
MSISLSYPTLSQSGFLPSWWVGTEDLAHCLRKTVEADPRPSRSVSS